MIVAVSTGRAVIGYVVVATGVLTTLVGLVFLGLSAALLVSAARAVRYRAMAETETPAASNWVAGVIDALTRLIHTVAKELLPELTKAPPWIAAFIVGFFVLLIGICIMALGGGLAGALSFS